MPDEINKECASIDINKYCTDLLHKMYQSRIEDLFNDGDFDEQLELHQVVEVYQINTEPCSQGLSCFFPYAVCE